METTIGHQIRMTKQSFDSLIDQAKWSKRLAIVLFVFHMLLVTSGIVAYVIFLKLSKQPAVELANAIKIIFFVFFAFELTQFFIVSKLLKFSTLFKQAIISGDQAIFEQALEKQQEYSRWSFIAMSGLAVLIFFFLIGFAVGYYMGSQ